MPIETRCPACQRKLKAPDKLLGKSVKCPNCQQAFTIEEPTEEAPARTAVTTRPAEPKRRPAYEEEDEAPPPRRRRRAEEEEEPEEEFADEEPEDEEDEDDRPRKRRSRKRSRRRASAAAAVKGPAIALMCVGGLALLLSLTGLVLNLLGTALLAPQMQGAGGGDLVANAVSGIGGAIFGICWGGVVVAGAVQMMRLSSYGGAMTAAIVAMVPCNLCCILGLPFGIWALVALNREDVKSAFR